MALNKEYERKTEAYIRQLEIRMYQPYQKSGFSGFVTKERLSFEEACRHPRTAYPEKTVWGRKWEYGWFFTEVVIPESCAGKRVVFRAPLGESTVWINGRLVGALDREHHMIILSKCGQPGEVYSVAMEVYAGHHAIPMDQKQVRLYIPEKPFQEFPEDVEQKEIVNAEIGVFWEEIFQLWMDLKTLMELRRHFDPNSWRLANINQCIKQVCDCIDIEHPIELLLEEAAEARKITQKCLDCKNGTSAPQMYAVGNSHLDLEWLWTKEETRRKSARTLGNQIQILEEYENYKYFHSQPWILDTVKREYPDLYQEVKEWVKKGRIIVEGGMWVEADTNIPGGESLIRQFLVGKRFLKEEFGVDSKLLWLPDIFGVSGNMPQIMKGCGIQYFLNAKVSWIYNGGEPFPHNNYMWQGIDGTEIQTHLLEDYAADSNPSSILQKWNSHQEKEEIPMRMFLYGHGDGGGGATRIQQEYIEREKDLEGLPKVSVHSPIEFFEEVKKNCRLEHTYVGEMYYAAHRGTYTSQAKTKQLSRYSEIALHEAEFWSALCGSDRRAELEELWKEVLFNHFHDIIPGTALGEVHKRAERSFAEVIAAADAIAEEARKQFVEPEEDWITAFNSLGWERKTRIEVPEGYTGLRDGSGEEAQLQQIHGTWYAFVKVPAFGMKTWKLYGNNEDASREMQRNEIQSTQEPLCETETEVLENNLIRAVFNRKGELVSLSDKRSGMEYIKTPSNRFRLYQDTTFWFDAWDIDSSYENLEVDCGDEAEVILEYRGELESVLRITRTLRNSRVQQRVIVQKDCPYLRFETEVDWKERHKLLKVDFDTNIHTTELVSEIQFGHVKRPNHKSRQYDADRFEVCQHRWSALCEAGRCVALLNDCKYGISADGGRMSLTLLRSATAPDMFADQGKQTFTYAVMPYDTTFYESDVIEQSYELNYPAATVRGRTEDGSWIRLSKRNVILETVKSAEDGSGDLILRLYESKNTYTVCQVAFGFEVKEVIRTNMLEETEEAVKTEGDAVTLPWKGFEIITLRVKRGKKNE